MIAKQMVGIKMEDYENYQKIKDIIEDMTLSVFNVGSKPINYKIIKSLPTTVNNIMKETGLTKVPVNQHINELEKFGLLQREKGTGKVYPTELSKLYISLINNVENYVTENVYKMLPNMIRNL